MAFDRHLAECGEGRTQLSSGERVAKLLRGLESAATAPQHVSYDQMAHTWN